MKKLVFLLAAVLFSSLIMRSQNVLDTIFDKYFLPDFIDVELCGSLLFYDQTGDNINTHMARNHYAFDVTGRTYDSIDGGWGRNSGVLDRAQPCYTDSLLTVKGIAVGVNYHTLFKRVQDSTLCKIILLLNHQDISQINYHNAYNSKPKGKLKLMNNTLNREIISVDIDTNFILYDTEQYSYIEYYFDNSVNVNGLFYIVEDVTYESTVISHMVFSKCNFPYHSLVRTAKNTPTESWVEWEEHYFNQRIYYDDYVKRPTYTYQDYFNISIAPPDSQIPNTCQMYMFPIFAETDTTLGDGTYPDTNVCLYDVNVDRYSNVYPNPANDIVTVQSSFKIREIEIHNTLGQVVLRKEGSQNIETIDVSNLQSGAYIVRIKTQRGFANKKILIE